MEVVDLNLESKRYSTADLQRVTLSTESVVSG
jgi:hypothetical protein